MRKVRDSENKLLRCMQKYKRLTGWRTEISKIAKMYTKTFDTALLMLENKEFVTKDVMGIDGDDKLVIRLSITEKGINHIAECDEVKNKLLPNNDIRNMIADIGYTQGYVAKRLGIDRTTLMRRLGKVMNEEKRNHLINQIKNIERIENEGR